MNGANAKTAREAREFRDLIRGEVARCERIVRSLLDSARRDPEQHRRHPGASSERPCGCSSGTPPSRRCGSRRAIPADAPAARIDADSLKQVVMALA